MANFDQQFRDIETAYGTQSTARVTFQEHMTKVYSWMFLGLAMTAVISFFVYITNAWMIFAANPFSFLFIALAELGLVIFLSARVLKMSFAAATASFMAYSMLNGLTLSLIFVAYKVADVAVVFGITALLFGCMSLVGMVTKRDLTGMGTMLLFGLLGIIIATLVNFFLHSTMLNLLISYLGVVIFLGLTAYDTQRIKRLYSVYGGTEREGNIAILGSLNLYLDFINLLLYILRIFGRRN